MTPKFGEVRRLRYGTYEIVVMALAVGPIEVTTDEGTMPDAKDLIVVLTLDRPDLGMSNEYYPIGGTATCYQSEWDDGEPLE